ncbi:LegC family aminotransferase [Bradyrhizobium sp. CCBAU 51753]|uniref:LegC family aminotransferase n=1 Tax=Bradyrhizobium sp. CCBAU 51753 TaxID=1325100 RepID=UPI00188CDED2|nr:LegC family aminotransferase [Bradyrhizobium sp. CCBAU 51753]QOZ27256.1 LegC family aminotransferase [Bradyrhizobium sp. CCBAU 51753]
MTALSAQASDINSAAVDLQPVLAAVDAVLGAQPRPVELHEPRFGARERELVLDCIDTNWVSSAGQYVTRFEQMVAKVAGARHAVAIVNGTAALHAALLLEGVKPNDEVLLPAITFVATANAVSHAGAVPHFVDSTWDTLGIDPVALDKHLEAIAVQRDGGWVNRQTGRRLRAVVPVHIFGHPVDMAALGAVAAKYGLVVVEDATESLGSTWNGQGCGTFGHSSVLSFNGNKIVTTGGGGMILTDDDDHARHARHFTSTAKKSHAWAFEHDEVAYNYRLPNINAALGCAQMERLEGMVAAKRELAERYLQAFSAFPWAKIYREPKGAQSNYWLNTLVLDRDYAAERDRLLAALHGHGIRARPLWTPMHMLPMYRDCPRAPLAVAEDMSARCINLPSSPFLAEAGRTNANQR